MCIFQMTGIEATKLLRLNGIKIPIFGVTGSVMNEDVEDFISSGADGVLSKPIDIDLLESKIVNPSL